MYTDQAACFTKIQAHMTRIHKTHFSALFTTDGLYFEFETPKYSQVYTEVGLMH